MLRETVIVGTPADSAPLRLVAMQHIPCICPQMVDMLSSPYH